MDTYQLFINWLAKRNPNEEIDHSWWSTCAFGMFVADLHNIEPNPFEDELDALIINARDEVANVLFAFPFEGELKIIKFEYLLDSADSTQTEYNINLGTMGKLHSFLTKHFITQEQYLDIIK